MRNRIFLAVGVLVLIIVNVQIAQKEVLARTGRVLLLELAPADPRSIIQGDYMRLDYHVSREAERALGSKAGPGWLVVRMDGEAGRFARIHDGGAVGPDEQLLYYRRVYRVRLGAESFFFQEGHAKHYEKARYGDLRVAPDGDLLLVGLRDAARQPIRP